MPIDEKRATVISMVTMISIIVTKIKTFIAVAMGMSERAEESGQAGWSVRRQAEDD